MVTINIPEQLARQLETIAQREQRTIDDVATSILEKNMPEITPLADNAGDAGTTLAAAIIG